MKVIRHLTVLALAVSPLLAAGCSKEPDLGRPDAAYRQLNAELAKQGMKRVDFQEASVNDVVTWLQSQLGFEVRMTPAARDYVARANPRITARQGEIPTRPARQAYEEIRFLLESKGLTVEPVENALGRPQLTVDRSTLREAVAAQR